MFFYFFDRHYGHDRVAQAQLEGVGAGDFLEARGFGYVLCLGESVSRLEQYQNSLELKLSDAEILFISPGCLSAQTLELLHRFVYQWCCSYKKAISLWIGDPDELAKREPVKKKKEKRVEDARQHLIIYPNLRSLSNDKKLDIDQEGYVMLHSQSTKKQKTETFWGIKNGSINTLVCTYSQMLQDRGNLIKIVLHDQHTWYYKSQQDPRYHAVDVAKKMSEIYECELELSGFALQG